MMGLLLIALLLLMLLLRQPVVMLLGFAAAYSYLVWGNGDVTYVVQDIWAAADQEVLLSLPLFILAGNIMTRGTIAERLINVMRIIAGPVPGGLALAAILSCAFFAAISGSSTVTLIAVGSIMYPALLAAGYKQNFALGALCAAGTLGIIVPPSIPLILYGVMTETSIADLFKAGVGPALLLTSLMALYSVIVNRRVPRSIFKMAALLASMKEGIFALFMPFLILGGIYAGWFTATESAAVAVLYAILVEQFIHKSLNMDALKGACIETAVMMGSLFPLLMMALSINTFMTYEQIPHDLVNWLAANIESRNGFLLLSLIGLLIIGFFMDIGSAILIIAPLLTPLAEAQGIDKVHFGIIMITNLEMGYLTPPMGLNLIIATTVFKVDFWTVSRAVLPFLALMLVGITIIAFWPALSLFLV